MKKQNKNNLMAGPHPDPQHTTFPDPHPHKQHLKVTVCGRIPKMEGAHEHAGREGSILPPPHSLRVMHAYYARIDIPAPL